MSRPRALLDGGRSGNEALGVSTFLQRSSNACGAGGTYAGTPRGRRRRTGESLRVPMAAALSWTVSNADSGVTRVRVGTGAGLILLGVQRSNAAMPSVLSDTWWEKDSGRITATQVRSGHWQHNWKSPGTRAECSPGHCQVDEAQRVASLEVEQPRSFSNRTSPYPTPGTLPFAAAGGEPTVADVGPSRDSWGTGSSSAYSAGQGFNLTIPLYGRHHLRARPRIRCLGRRRAFPVPRWSAEDTPQRVLRGVGGRPEES
jgi:hypothetical protein